MAAPMKIAGVCLARTFGIIQNPLLGNSQFMPRYDHITSQVLHTFTIPQLCTRVIHPQIMLLDDKVIAIVGQTASALNLSLVLLQFTGAPAQLSPTVHTDPNHAPKARRTRELAAELTGDRDGSLVNSSQ